MDTVLRPTRVETGAIALAIGILLGFFLRGCIVPEPSPVGVIETRSVPGGVTITHDTLIRVVPRALVQVKEQAAHIIVEHDTLVQVIDSSAEDHRDTLRATPFRANADTVIGRDTITQMFQYPPPRLSLVLRQGADTMSIPRETIRIVEQRPTPWYEELGKIGGGVVLGFVLRLATEPKR